MSIDGTPTAGIALPDVIARFRGAPGSEAVVSVSRPEWGGVREFRLVRVPAVPMSGVNRKLLEGIGYLKVRRFQEDTAAEVRAALDALRSAGARAIVLDLRHNSGGLLTASIEVAELFLENNQLVTYTQGRVRQQNMRFSAQVKRPMRDLPLAVLVNEGTAGGAEIIGAALQDWGRATVVGTRTLGRTTLQSAIPLENGATLRLTTARWFTPKGRSLAGTGLTPDTEADDDEDPLRMVGEPEHDVQLRGAISVLGALTSR